MKNKSLTKQLTFAALIAAGLALLSTSTARAQIITTIGVQYINTSSDSLEIGVNTAGVDPASGWNEDDGAVAISNLKDSGGINTGISLSAVTGDSAIYGVYKQQYAFAGGSAGAGDKALFNSGVLPNFDVVPASAGSLYFTLSNLNAADTYTLYVYAMTDISSVIAGNIGGANYYLKPVSGNTDNSYSVYTQGTGTTHDDATPNGDYFEFDFTGVTSITYTSINEDGHFNDLPGFQLIQSAQSAQSVPEPSIWAMMLVGLVSLVGLQRFTRKV